MRTGSILFLVGTVILIQLAELPSLTLLLLLPLCLLLIFKGHRLRWPACLLSGFLWTLLHAGALVGDRLDAQIEGLPLVIEGRVVSLPEQGKSFRRFEFVIEELVDAQGNSWDSPGKVRLSWYRSHQVLLPGETWRLQVKLKRPIGFMNPGGFDYEAWLFQKRINATGYVLKTGENIRLQAATGSYIHRMRFELRQRLDAILNGTPMFGLIAGLALGDRSAISAEQWRVLTRTGTNHLLAISGLHIGFIAGLVFFISRWLWPFAGVFLHGIAAPRLAALNAMIAALVYAALAGFSIPTQRALIMLGIVLGLSFCYRRTSISHTITLALLLIVIIDPLAVMSVGFWLSFSAIIVIFYGMAFRVDVNSLWWRWGRAQFLVALGLLPLLVLWFQQVPLLSILANCVAVPWVSLLTVPLVLGGSLLLFISETAGRLMLELGGDSLELLWGFLEMLADMKFTVLPVASPSLAAFIAALVAVAILLMPSGLPARWLGAIWLLPLLVPSADLPEKGHFRLLLLDVGQGLAAVVQTRNHVMLYDTGPKYSERFNAGSGVILPYLRHNGVDKISILVQGHGDNDHIGGLLDVLDGMAVEKVLSSVPERIPHPNVLACEDGQSWHWDGVLFEILHPQKTTVLRGNDRSCVVRISQGRYSVLLTGDIERRAEQRLIDAYPKKLASNILIAPHHGSKTSSSAAFIGAVSPDYVLFPVGYRNRFNFPKKDIIDRYKRRGITMLDTVNSGAIEMQWDKSGLTIIHHRKELRRFWHRQLADPYQ